MGRFIDLTGKTFNRITALKRAEDYISPTGKHSTVWFCRCRCGTEKSIRSNALLNGRAQSCGCLNLEIVRRNNSGFKHGLRHTRIYTIWCNMKARCTNPKADRFANYGGKGVAVCKEWFNDFMAFYDWAIANGYSDSLSIDRADSGGNYEPNNCRWATADTQANNKTTNRFVEYNGGTKTISEIAKEEKIPYDRIYQRVARYKWDIDRAVREPSFVGKNQFTECER